MAQQDNIPSPQQGEAQPEYAIQPEHIAQAERLIGLNFTPEERQQMLETINARPGNYEKLREIRLGNEISPALYFDPRPVPTAPAEVPRTYAMSDQGSITRPENLEDVAFWAVTQLAELIRTQQVTSLELTEMYLDRLKRYDPLLKCVVSLTEDLARQQASRADAEIAAGRYRGPLHGIPWGAKDLLATHGYKTTWGAEPFKDQVIDLNATVIQRLEEAGAVLIAKLTLGALAYGDIWFDGRTNNPWNIDDGSSGSSAGPASATAGGLVGFSIGTETLGSIVSPSTRCGVTGLRPTFGRVSRYGAMALVWSMDKIGPMCRSVEDCALVFSAIYGPDGHDRTITDVPFTWNPDLDAKALRVGYYKRAFDETRTPPNPDSESEDDEPNIYPNNDHVLDVLREQGFDLIELDLPQIAMEPLLLTLFVEAAAAFDELTRDNADDLMAWQDEPAWPNTFRAARFIPAVEYVQASRARTVLIQQMAAVMAQVDVFVTPSFGGNVLQITNLTGHPAVVLPNGFNLKDTPTSISFVGGLYKEAETLAVAKAYQDATGWHLQHPKMVY